MICGVDEAGRGPLAGPVVAASVILTCDIPGLYDSKKLSEKKRFQLFDQVTRHAVAWSFAVSSAKEIDDLNIRQATLLAMKRSVDALVVTPSNVLVDGRDTIDVPFPCSAIVKGDQKEIGIMAASIIAKCMRDQIMRMLAIQLPLYGFDKHFGYPTKQHCETIRRIGVSRYHRMSFKPCNVI